MIDSLLGEQQENVDPYTTFVYAIRSPYTKESYLRRLRGFFDAINLDKDKTLEERCNLFVHNVPDLELYIINVHPSKKYMVSAEDRDSVKDRINDITYSDRNSHYDEMVADLATAYTELIYNLKELAKRHFRNKDQSATAFQEEFENILKANEEKSSGSAVEDRKYKELIKGRFKVTVTRIENESYEDSIYGKVGDSTSKTIEELIDKGKRDAQKVLGIVE